MKKFALAGLTLAASVITASVVFAPAAFAADTGPGTVACAQASADVRAKADSAAQISSSIASGQDAVLAPLKAAVVTAQATYDTAYTAWLTNPTAANLTARDAAQVALKAAQDKLSNAPGVPASDKAKLDAANAALADAVKARNVACTVPVPAVPTVVTTTPAVPTTTAPVTTVVVPNAIDTGYSL